jgi:hypothetical protein
MHAVVEHAQCTGCGCSSAAGYACATVQQQSTSTAAARWFLSKGPRYAAAACAPGKAPLNAPTVMVLVLSSPAVVCV